LLFASGLLAGGALGAAAPGKKPAGDPASQVEEVPLPPTLMPYLQNPAADGMTVCFVAQGAEQVRVAWGPADEEPPQAEVSPAATPLPGTPWTIWKTRLSGLRPATAYRYQVHYRLPSGDDAAPPRRFRTLDPKAGTLRIAVFNDLHNNADTLNALMRQIKPEDFEFSVLLGDCWTDPSAAKEASLVFRTLDAYVRLLDAANKPMVFLRGNHEMRGSFSKYMARLFDLPNLDASKDPAEPGWQFTLRAGPVFFLAMDTGEDDDFDTPQDSYKRPKFWQDYRQRQLPWLQGVLDRGAGAEAPWRVFLSHMALYSNEDFSEPSRRYWEPLLLKAGIDLMIAGHEHTWNLLPKSKAYTITYSKESGKPPRTMTPPWPILIGGGPTLKEGTVILLSADGKTLRARLLAAKGGRTLTEFITEKNPAK
ncbi:MAG: metallophosphoesterase, partial [Planctomycetota bacterium]|nr:metallophosphoesterase [Planctomycetota bacterium]